MGTIEKFARVCTTSGQKFEDYPLPIGAIYGRIGTTLFVSTDRHRERRKVEIMAKRGVCAWGKEKIPVTCDIYDLIRDCEAKIPKKAEENPPKNTGKPHYVELGPEFPLPEDYEDSETGPRMRKVAEFDAVRHRPFPTATEDGRSEIMNECSFWAIYQDLDRRVEDEKCGEKLAKPVRKRAKSRRRSKKKA